MCRCGLYDGVDVGGSPGQGVGIFASMENMPSPARAERNQRRKLAFVPVWPVVAAIAVVVCLVVLTR